MGSIAESPELILKPSNDKRDYLRIILPNGLQALLISDPDTDKAAASMYVNVGYFSDPDDLQGLAHFLEHMLFYSSEKYPVEDSYMKYLSEHGGSSNAYTSSEHTNFYFDVNADHLEEALDRFSQFFVCPLMSADATAREMNAVDSENKKNLTNDLWRFDQLLRHKSSKSHPYSKFGTGNLETLDVFPKSKGIDTREELVKFYEGHYSSSLMCLVVYGKETLQIVQNLVETKFSAIKNRKNERVCFSGQPCDKEHLQILIKAVPVKEQHTLTLCWPIKPELPFYKEAPTQYISHLLGHEAEGSLFSLLKKHGWATGLSAGEDDQSLEYAFFRISIELTDLGQSHVDDIIGYTFQYIQILVEKGVKEWIFNELKTVREINFHYKDKYAPIRYVPHLARNMQHYPPEDWLAGSSLPRIFNAESIMNTLQMLTPENVRILSASKEYDGKTTDIEPWYGTSFSVEKIPDDDVEKWKTTLVDERLHLPSANPFLPTDLSIKPVEKEVDHPSLLRASAMSKLWYKPDFCFQTPKACIEIHFDSPESRGSPESSVLSRLYLSLLLDYLNDHAYYAEVAGLSYGIFKTSSGFQVSVSGYNHKISVLLDKIIEKMVNFDVKEDRFMVVKEKLVKEYLNFRFIQPYQQALYYCSLILEHKKWNIDALIEAIDPLQPTDLAMFYRRLFSRVHFECYAAGNLSAEEAESLTVGIEKSLHSFESKSVSEAQHAERRITRLTSEMSFYYPVTALNMADANSAVHLYLQVCQDDTRTNALLELFIMSAKQEVFYQLRSVQQLGYIVVLADRNDFGVRGAQFIIQSVVKDPSETDSRIENFINSFEDNLKQLSNEEFKRNVDALVKTKLEKHKNLREETQFYWSEIDSGSLKFRRQQDEVAVLRELEKQDLYEFYLKYIKAGGSSRSKLSIHVYGGAHEENFKAHLDSVNSISLMVKVEKTDMCIKNIFEFKRSQPLFGSLK